MAVTGAACGTGGATVTGGGPTVEASCPAPVPARGLLADTAEGTVVAVDPASLHTSVVATHVLADGGLAFRPQLDRAYVTSVGAEGRPAIWAISVSRCRHDRSLVEAGAELPSVSPDGGDLAFVMLDPGGRQTGVAIVGLGATGMPRGGIRRYRATSVPPPLPITGMAVGVGGAPLAVWGGAVDGYLGKAHPTVGTLDPPSTTSLASLRPVFDEEGISVPFLGDRRNQGPEDWQSAPAYLANGELLVGDGDSAISMPFTDTTPGVSGGGIRVIVHGTGPIRSLAAGPNGSLAWVGTDRHLTVAPDAVDLPFGPQAEVPPRLSPPASRRVSGRFTSVAWAIPPAEAPPAPAVFHLVAHLPSVVGLSLATATTTMTALALPVFVGHTEADPAVPPGTVLAQDPPAGTGVECQCSVALTVSSNH
jgi:hypothetical protein